MSEPSSTSVATMPAVPEKKAWTGWNAPAPATTTQSAGFENIMSEELAKQLAAEDEVDVHTEKKPVKALSDHELALRIQECLDRGEDPSYLFELQEQVQSHTAQPADPIADGGESELDASAALARQLLEEDRAAEQARREKEDKDLALALQLQEEMLKKNQQDTSFESEAHRLKYETLPAGAATADTMEDLSDDEWTAVVHSGTTKHDADVCGIRNTKRLERDFDQAAGLVEDRIKLTGRVANSLKQHFRKGIRKGVSQHGKVAQEERASVHGVLDKRTELVLFSWVSTGQLEKMSGALRTGKEASVFHAHARPEIARQVEQMNHHSHRGLDDVVRIEQDVEATNAAVKIFKTTLSDFKNRSDYVVGDHRFAHLSHRDGKTKGHALRNTRKLVMTWCEKEFKNLHRLFRAGIACPEPYFFKENVLCMEFIGKHGRPAAQLQEVPLTSAKRFKRFYVQLVVALWKMYHVCSLVHGDLSPYNILYFDGKLFIIDVGQAVVTDHPRAKFFLQRDCTEVSRYFIRASRGGGKCAGIPILSAEQLTEFIVGNTFGWTKSTVPADSNPVAEADVSMEELEQRIKAGLTRTIHKSNSSSPASTGSSTMGWKMEMALRLATTHDGTKTQAREDNSSAQFHSRS